MSMDEICWAVGEMMHRAKVEGLAPYEARLGGEAWTVFNNDANLTAKQCLENYGKRRICDLPVKIMNAPGVAVLARPIYLDVSNWKS